MHIDRRKIYAAVTDRICPCHTSRECKAAYGGGAHDTVDLAQKSKKERKSLRKIQEKNQKTIALFLKPWYNILVAYENARK